ncbi:MAG TPA: DUF2808 domain-containing protein [Xenococcaceae cyanobacterium]
MHKQIVKLGSWGLAMLWGCGLSLGVNRLMLVSADAVTAPDGTVSFNQSPLLTDAHTTFSSARARGATYYFDVELPTDVGEPLQQVVIRQRQGAEAIEFKLDQTVAYIGNHRQKEQQLEIGSVSQAEASNGIEIVFDSPIPPGTNFTVGIKPTKNPFYDGVYLFGVTAFPAGEQANGLYLGVGRLHFYRSGDGISF